MGAFVQDTLVLCILIGYGLMEFLSRRYQQTVSVNASANDTKLELLMFLSLVAITQPLALLGSNLLCQHWMPAQQGVLAGLPWWGMLGLLLVADDLTQYLWHRASHTPLLWPLHRAHHSAKYMSIRMTYRNNFFYYLLMPGLWSSGVLVYLGLGKAYLPYIVVKLAVIMGAHCAWPWDAPLYKIRWMRPVMWIVERTISTPATHWAHHALTDRDGIGHYKGNYGNLLFFWDVLFRTAHITRQYPAAVGLQDDLVYGEEHWADQMFYPLSQSKREQTALRPGGTMFEEREGVQIAAVAAVHSTAKA